MRISEHVFAPRDLVGGHIAIDLVNTVTARNADPIDWLDGFPRLLEWAELTGAFDGRTLQASRRLGESDRRAAALALRHVKELREAMLGVLSAIIEGADPPPEELLRLERHWKAALAHSRIEVRGGRARLRVDIETSGLEFLTHELALRSLELLQALPVERTRICRGTRCGWAFIDRSKSGRRRWCDMATCGNAAKSRRHYQRTRHGGGPATP